MPAYVFANIRVDDPVAYEQYLRMVPATIESFGGRYLARGGRVEVLEGAIVPGRTIILEFPAFEDAERWYHSEEYCAAKTVRQSCAKGELIIVDGV
jgi:uncharacterized protein (DUF1330 family)